MTVKVSEKKFFLGIFLLITSIVVFIEAEIFKAPVIVSEKGMFAGVFSIVLFVIAVRLCKKSLVKR